MNASGIYNNIYFIVKYSKWGNPMELLNTKNCHSEKYTSITGRMPSKIVFIGILECPNLFIV